MQYCYIVLFVLLFIIIFAFAALSEPLKTRFFLQMFFFPSRWANQPDWPCYDFNTDRTNSLQMAINYTTVLAYASTLFSNLCLASTQALAVSTYASYA